MLKAITNKGPVIKSGFVHEEGAQVDSLELGWSQREVIVNRS